MARLVYHPGAGLACAAQLTRTARDVVAPLGMTAVGASPTVIAEQGGIRDVTTARGGQPYARAQGAPVYVAILDGDRASSRC
jgi:hypothetical protein